MNGTRLSEGDTITLDGTTGRIFLGTPEVVCESLDAELAEIENWRRLAGRSARVKSRTV